MSRKSHQEILTGNMEKRTRYCNECGMEIIGEAYYFVPLSQYEKGIFPDQYFHERCYENSDKHIRIGEDFEKYLARISGAKLN